MASFVDLPKASKYKDTPIFAGTRGLEFGLFAPPSEAIEPDPDYSVHRLRRHEVGFFDKLSVLYYGEGNEILLWFVQLTNAVLDPEKDLVPVCPNCHAMLHRSERVLTIEELKGRLAEVAHT